MNARFDGNDRLDRNGLSSVFEKSNPLSTLPCLPSITSRVPGCIGSLVVFHHTLTTTKQYIFGNTVNYLLGPQRYLFFPSFISGKV
jgi:hypothetical protein